MPVCCRCNGSGRCISCSCVKSGSPCVNCLPLRNGHCNNAGIRTLTSLPKDCQHSNVPPQLRESPTSDTDQVPSRQAPTETGPPMSSSDASLVNTLQSPGVAEHASYCANTTTVEEAAHEIPQVRTLPLFKPMSSLDCIWGEKSGQEFSDAVDCAYGYIVHWKPNLFKVPSGAIGKRFVAELACLFEGYAAESAFEGFAIKAAMTLPALVLQKPHAKSKTHEHNSCLQRRMELWQKGDVEELLREGKAIQKSFKTSLSARRGDQDEAKKARKFAQLMMEGRVRATLQYLTKDAESGPLRLDEAVNDGSGRTVRDVLEDKHPDPEPVNADAIVSETPDDNFHPIVFDNITPEAIRKSALLTTGSAGPSGVTAMMWRRLCTAFGQRSNDLCSALAAIARRICTTYVDPSGLMAYTACRLVALDKCPGVRPVGVGEVVRRIMGKAIMRVVRQDLQDAVGSIQLCAGQEAGCEAAVHAMRTIFDNDDTEAMIFVDATNAFNRLNRRVTLVNCGVICPAMSAVLTNTYRDNSWLFIDGQCMLSREGTTQGDPLAMGMYAIGTQPLIRRLHGIANQVWYADDSAAGSSLERLRQWWDILEEAGSLYGYFPNGSKTHILAKPEYADAARKMFEGTGISVSTAGERYLGGAIGAASFIQQYIERKVNLWVREIEKLSKFAVTQPHAAYAAFTHGLSSRWNYLLRVTDWEALSSIEILQPLETAIQSLFIPALSGQPPPNELVRDMLALPARLGGLGLTNPVATAEEQQAASQLISAPLIECIVCQDHCLADCQAAQREAKARYRSHKRAKQKEDARTVQSQLPNSLKRCMELSQERGASTWLTALPIEDHGFALHKTAFRDALSFRYNWPFQNSPSHCSCGHPFNIEHTLSCKTGGFPAVRHNEVRDITASLLSEVCHGVSTEPHLQPLAGESMSHRSAISDDGARLDVAMYGFWGGRFEKAFLDVRVFNPSAKSNQTASITSIYRRHEQEKKRQYEQRIREVERATFTPLVMSTTGGMGKAASTFYKRLASMLSEKRGISYSQTINWVRCRLSFALLRASILSVRGSRSSRYHPVAESLQGPIDLQLAEGHIH